MNLKSPLIGSYAALALFRLQFSLSLYCQRKQVLTYVTGVSDDPNVITWIRWLYHLGDLLTEVLTDKS